MASAANIPLIDISASGEDAQLKVAKELVDAAVLHGFVYVRNTGADIPADAVERAFDLVLCWPRFCPVSARANWGKIIGQEDIRSPSGGEGKMHYPEE